VKLELFLHHVVNYCTVELKFKIRSDCTEKLCFTVKRMFERNHRGRKLEEVPNFKV
jgi:hypothetical protein